jgi:hypothetical protein
MCFLSLLLEMCCSTFIDLCMLNHPCIPGMKLTWLWWIAQQLRERMDKWEYIN